MDAKICLLRQGLNLSSVQWSLLKYPDLWNQNKARTTDPQSPHYGLDDIWVRFGNETDCYDNTPHQAHWYPAADLLGVKGLCLDVMRAYNGTELGGVLITRIPPGGICKPHRDLGWHAKVYEKFAIQIAAAPGQSFCFDGENLETKPGDLFWFNNQELHWVINDSEYERITMIICIRVEKDIVCHSEP